MTTNSRKTAADVVLLLRVREYLWQHSSTHVTLDELSALSGLSRYHLVRSFAKMFGVPPHAYQVRVQVGKACALLASGHPPAIVAAETGFADQSHFIRHFRQIFGVTPGQYLGRGRVRH